MQLEEQEPHQAERPEDLEVQTYLPRTREDAGIQSSCPPTTEAGHGSEEDGHSVGGARVVLNGPEAETTWWLVFW